MQKMPYYINGGGMKECIRMELGLPTLTNTGVAVFKK